MAIVWKAKGVGKRNRGRLQKKWTQGIEELLSNKRNNRKGCQRISKRQTKMDHVI